MKKCMFILMILFTAVSFVHADLIAHYTMEEGAGAITDQAGGETAEPVDAGQIYGVESYPGFGSAVELSDNGSWQLDATESVELQSLTNNFTVASWVYLDSETQAAKTGANESMSRIIGDDVAWDGDAWSFGIDDASGSNILFFTKNGIVDIRANSAVIDADQWVHIAAVVSSTDGVLFYINGQLAQTSSNTAGCNAGDDIFGIGRCYGNGEAQWWPGLLDDLRVYNNVLTEAEVAALMDSGNIAGLIAPADGATTQPIDVDLQWSAPTVLVPSGYTLNIRAEDPNWLDTANTAVINDATSPYTTALSRDTTYYWRVDAIDPNDGGTPIVFKGLTWSFTTVLSVPEFAAGSPADALADSGSDVVFEVVATNPFTLDDTGMTYQWTKDGSPIADGAQYQGTTTDTLTVAAVDVDDEGEYLCQVTITSNTATADSPAATLDVKRLVSHWPFEGTLEDVVGGSTGTTSAGDPNFAAGIIGTQAADFDATKYILVPTTALKTAGWTLSWWENSDPATGSSGQWETQIGCGDLGPENSGYEVFEFGRESGYRYAFGFNENGDEYKWSPDDTELYPRGQWHFHVVALDDATDVASWYIDGEKYYDFQNRNNPLRPQLTVGDLHSSNESWSQAFAGQIDELKLYNYALTPTEVAVEYTNTIDTVICTEPIVGDLDGDCQVNTNDLALMALSWLDCNWIPSCL